MEKRKLSIKEIAIFGMIGGVMYASKILMAVLPNIHLLGAFIISLTIVYGFKALYPIYVFVLLEGLFNGFSPWWIPNLYIWLPLWGVSMILPKSTKAKTAPVVYCLVCCLHGLLYGTLYAPFQALYFGLNFKGMIAWIIAGLPFDLIHAVSNFFMGLLVIPLSKIYRLAEKSASK